MRRFRLCSEWKCRCMEDGLQWRKETKGTTEYDNGTSREAFPRY